MDPFHGLSAREWREAVRRAARRYEQEHGQTPPETGIPETYLHQAAQEVRSRRLSWRSAPVMVGAWLLCAGVMTTALWGSLGRYAYAPGEDFRNGASCPFESVEAPPCSPATDGCCLDLEPPPVPVIDVPPPPIPRMDDENLHIRILGNEDPLVIFRSGRYSRGYTVQPPQEDAAPLSIRVAPEASEAEPDEASEAEPDASEDDGG